MLVVHGLDPLLSLLLLLLLDPHSPEGGHPPQRRFEYKLSFKGPRLALPGAGIPFWSHHGDAILGLEEVRLAPSMRNRSGAVWSRTPVLFPAWEVEVQMRVTGPGRLGAQGMAVWYTRGRGQVSSVLGALDSGDSIGILFDSSAEDTQKSPAIRVLVGNGHNPDEPLGDGASRVLGSCHRAFRNRPNPFRARITYWRQRLRVSLNSGLTPSDPDELCVDVGPLLLAPGGFFGVLAATSTLADDHDVLSFLTFSLSEPGPEGKESLTWRKHWTDTARSCRLSRVSPNSWPRLRGNGRRSWGPQTVPGLRAPGRARGRPPEGRGCKSLGKMESEKRGAVPWALEKRLALPQDSAKVSALLHGQLTLLQDLQEMRDAAAHMASRAQVFYLPEGTKHHFLELAQILSLLQKDLRGPAKAAAKDPRPPGRPPGIFSCLRPGIFLFFLLVQTVGFFCYVHFSSKQELDKNLQDYLSTGSLPLSPAPQISRALGALRRQPLYPNIHA
ncbi:protein ERGIC-53-like isoform X3 [Phacochoerus africanus]|uniref:protein ERGIC-53-like isoform X3 n=1 Tax=Phacochoerus africanus TaxID=41426 RepID=UPI001FD8ABB9|nr:protein ERGIC-53-like isoform X3 [Phacochoerus africanus]